MRLHIDDRKINRLQRQSIAELVTRAKHAHITDVVMRINGKEVRVQADWLKHLTLDGCDCVDAHEPHCPVAGGS